LTVTRRDQTYRAARKTDWGDAWRDAPESSTDD
jgi:ribosomal protein RSM22 (predicted rRNA methylase)